MGEHFEVAMLLTQGINFQGVKNYTILYIIEVIPYSLEYYLGIRARPEKVLEEYDEEDAAEEAERQQMYEDAVSGKKKAEKKQTTSNIDAY